MRRLEPPIEFVLLPPRPLLRTQFLHLVLRQIGFGNLGVRAAAFFLMPLPPGVAFAWRTIHAAFHEPKIGRLMFAWSNALPDVRSIAVDLIMKCVIDGDEVASMIVDCICKE